MNNTNTPHNTQRDETSDKKLSSSDTVLMSLQSVSYRLNESGINQNYNHHSPRLRRQDGWLTGRLTGRRTTKSNKVNDYKENINSSAQRTLLSNISLQILPYEKISVIGPNGAGKSTLMKLMLGLIDPTSGKISRHTDLSIGYVPQKFNVPTILPLRVQDLLAQTFIQLTDDEKAALYQRLSITPLLKKQVIYLSGGETQRVLLARSLLTKPNLLILDEPMQGLDPESERWLYEFIDDLPSFLQCAMVVVSHDLHWVMRGSRRVICLNKHICCEGQPSDLEVSDEFKKLFGHQYEQPYIHKHHDCQHDEPHLL